MNFFSPVLLALLVSLSVLPAAQAAVTVASGNIYDVGQNSGNADENSMSWAAAAANVIQHWQDAYRVYADTSYPPPNGFASVDSETPAGTGDLKVYQEILAQWKPGNGRALNGIGWWMQGLWITGKSEGFIYYPSESRLKDEWADLSGGYFTDVFGDYKDLFNAGKGGLPIYPQTQNAAFFSARVEFSRESDLPPYRSFFEKTLKKAFATEGQAVALTIQKDSSGAERDVTCWGYEEDADGRITTLILTDSADDRYGAFMVDLMDNADQTAHIRTDCYGSEFSEKTHVQDAAYILTLKTTFDATGAEGIPCGGNVVIGMDFGTDVMFNGSPAITMLLPGEEPMELIVQQPGMVMFAMPEPATSTLSPLAPAALCARRRR